MNADHVDLYTIEICAGVGMLGEGLRAGLTHMGLTHRTVAYLEREAYAASVLAARMEDGALDGAPVWPDLLTFDGRAWRGAVDCIAAGFPCQDLSLAGRRAGLDGARSGLFFNIVDIADACGARFLFLENVAGIASATASVVDEAEGELDERAAARVLGELADRGWHAEWLTLSASEVGASHGRARWFCFAWRSVANASSGNGRELARPDQRGLSQPHGRTAESPQLAHPGLQHQHLQQWQDGAEHSGAGQPVAYTKLPERRAISVCGDGGQQGHDGGWREADGRAGVTTAVVGHPYQQRQQQPYDTDSAQPRGNARACSCGTSCELADPGCSNARRVEHITVACGCATEYQSGSGHMANPSSPRLPQRIGGEQLCDQPTERNTGPDLELYGCPLFAPGPSDPRWAGIIATQPWLAPAIDKATESLLCRAPDGLAAGLDFSHRAQRLKCVGNGVVALQAAAAFVVLAERAGLMKKHPLALIDKAPAAIELEATP